MMFSRSSIVYIGSLLIVLLQGCSVGMALSEGDNPNLSVLHAGTPRGQVEQELGKPIESVRLSNGLLLDTYEYELGDEASGGRAAGHLFMDLMTFGLWEIAGTPIEASMGEYYQARVTYDDDKVVKVETTKTSRDGSEAEERLNN